MSALLEVRGVRAAYGRLNVLRGIDLAIGEGELVALVGPNGAGKSTLLHTIAGQVRATSGSISMLGIDLSGADAAERARCGITLVPEGRATFPNLSVAENLRIATARPERQWSALLDDVLALFPVLAARSGQRAATLSGGEQRMLALARALCAQPRLLLLDEPSLGLAPRIVNDVFKVIGEFRARGIAVLLVEQYAARALEIADAAFLMLGGRMYATDETHDTAALHARYVGGAA